jgi:hypothetical protein
MRCYLMRHGHIAGVELLTPGPDECLIEQGKVQFEARKNEGFEGFEVWDGARFLFRFPNHHPSKKDRR